METPGFTAEMSLTGRLHHYRINGFNGLGAGKVIPQLWCAVRHGTWVCCDCDDIHCYCWDRGDIT